MYLGGGIIRYNADKDDRSWLKTSSEKFERRGTSIVDVWLIEALFYNEIISLEMMAVT